MGYISKPFPIWVMFLCLAIILIGGGFTLYHVCTYEYPQKIYQKMTCCCCQK